MNAEMEVTDGMEDELKTLDHGIALIKRRQTTHWKAVAKAAERLAADRFIYCEQLQEALKAARALESQAVKEATRSELVAVLLAVVLAVSVFINVKLVLG